MNAKLRTTKHMHRFRENKAQRTSLLLPALVLLGTSIARGEENGISELQAVEAHVETCYSVSLSPSSDVLATAGFGKIKLWTVENRESLATLEGHKGKVLALDFSPDGGTLISGADDKTVKLWAIPGSGPKLLKGHSGRVLTLAVSPNGRWLASGAEDNTVIVWDRGTRLPVYTLKGLGGAPRSLAFNAKGELLAAGCSDASVHIWTLAEPPVDLIAKPGATLAVVPLDHPWRYQKGDKAAPEKWTEVDFDASKWPQGNSGFGYSDDEKELATIKTKLDDMGKKYISVFIRTEFSLADPTSLQNLLLTVLIDDGFVAYLNGEAVGRHNVEGDPPAHDATASGSDGAEPLEVAVDLTEHLGKLKKGKNVLAIQGHNRSKESTDFVLSPTLNAVLKVVETAPNVTAPPGTEVFTKDGLGGTVTAVALASDGAWVATGNDKGELRLHPRGGDSVTLATAGGPVSDLAALDDTSLVAALGDGTIKLYGSKPGEEKATFSGHEGAVRAISLSGDGKVLASAGEDRTVRLWNVEDGKELKKLSGHEGPVVDVSLSPDGKTVVSGSSDKSMRVWNAEDGSVVDTFSHEGEMTSVGFSSGGRFYSSGAGNDVTVWQPTKAKELATFTGHENLVQAVAFSPDGQTIASASSDTTIRLWSVAGGKEILNIKAHDGSIYSINFSPGGTMLASGSYDRTIRVWNVADGQQLRKIVGHDEAVFAVDFTPDGASLVTASSDHTARVWDVESGKLTRTLKHPGWVMGLAVSPDGGKFASADYGGNLFLWGVDDEKPVASAKIDSPILGLTASTVGALFATATSDGQVFLFRWAE